MMKFEVSNLGLEAQTVAGVIIAAGETRDLLDAGAAYEAILTSPTLFAGIAAGTLNGPPQALLLDDAADGHTMSPGESVVVTGTTAPATITLPPAAMACMALGAVHVQNCSANGITLALAGADGVLPDASALAVAPGTAARLQSVSDGAAWIWARS